MKVGLVALALTSGCLRFGYDVAQSDNKADASVHDAGSRVDAGKHTADAAARSGSGGTGGGSVSNAGSSGAAGRAGAGGASAGSGGAQAQGQGGSTEDAGSDVDQVVGDTGLHVTDILGFYTGPWGDMVLRAHGDLIWGAYKYDGGTIVGQVQSDGVFAGWWSQLPSRDGMDAGEVEFTWLVQDGTTMLDGRWRYGTNGTWYDNWDDSLVTDRSPPSTLTDRFDDPNNFKSHP